jgi:hypothetical protein
MLDLFLIRTIDNVVSESEAADGEPDALVVDILVLGVLEAAQLDEGCNTTFIVILSSVFSTV